MRNGNRGKMLALLAAAGMMSEVVSHGAIVHRRKRRNPFAKWREHKRQMQRDSRRRNR